MLILGSHRKLHTMCVLNESRLLTVSLTIELVALYCRCHTYIEQKMIID